MTQRQTPEGTMQIGEVAERTELSLRSLRHWDEVGLVRPSGRSEGGFRLYTEPDVERILLIRRMKPLGFTLDQMRAVAEDMDVITAPDASAIQVAAARERLAAIAGEADERRSQLVRQLAMADEFIGLLGDAMQ